MKNAAIHNNDWRRFMGNSFQNGYALSTKSTLRVRSKYLGIEGQSRRGAGA
jgi:hypothetical protein